MKTHLDSSPYIVAPRSHMSIIVLSLLNLFLDFTIKYILNKLTKTTKVDPTKAAITPACAIVMVTDRKERPTEMLIKLNIVMTLELVLNLLCSSFKCLDENLESEYIGHF